MSSRINWSDIQRLYPDQWVVVVDFEIQGRDLVKGVVVQSDSDKVAIDMKSRSVTEPHAVIFTGEHKRGLIGLYAQDVEDSGVS